MRDTVLTREATIIGQRLAALAVGTPLTLRGFKRYTNGVSGFTHLVALGETTLPTGERATFEYDWGSVDLRRFTRAGKELPSAAPVWEAAR